MDADPNDTPRFRPAIPILRVNDARASEQFYAKHFRFKTDWVHQFEPGFPMMMSISRGECTLFLSEHSGTGTNNCEVYIFSDDVDTEFAYASSAGLKFELEPTDQEWGVREIMFRDLDNHRFTVGKRLQ